MIHIEENQGTIYDTGKVILSQHGTVIVGMSPGNGYFDEETVHEVLQFASTVSGDVRIMIPDLPAVHTYRALGDKKPEKKARLAGNNLQNKCLRSMQRIAQERPEISIRLIAWKDDIGLHPQYQRERQSIRKLYEKNTQFRADARETTRAVLQTKYRGNSLSSAIDEGVNYLLDELAFLTTSLQVLGVERAVYLYHQGWPIFENLVNGAYDGIPRKNIGTVVAKKT